MYHAAKMINPTRLHEILAYDPLTGIFTWRQPPANRAQLKGQVAGCLDSDGYVVIKLDRKLYKAHRLAIVYMKGRNFLGKVDHKNRVRNDNRYENLRITDTAGNNCNKGRQVNNTSGHTGVTWQKRAKKWRAYIKRGTKEIHLGLFSDLADAVTTRQAAEVAWDSESSSRSDSAEA